MQSKGRPDPETGRPPQDMKHSAYGRPFKIFRMRHRAAERRLRLEARQARLPDGPAGECVREGYFESFFIIPSSFFIMPPPSSFFMASLDIASFFMPSSLDMLSFFIMPSSFFIASCAKAAGASARLSENAAAETPSAIRVLMVIDGIPFGKT